MSKKRIITMVKKMADENMKVAIDRDEFMDYSTSLMEQVKLRDKKLYTSAIIQALHEDFHFGKVRLVRIKERVDELVAEYEDNEKFKQAMIDNREIVGRDLASE